MNTNPYHQLYKRCVIASVLCYIISCIVPVYSVDAYRIDWAQGLFMLFFGWVAIIVNDAEAVILEWLANPIYFILLSFCLINLLRKQEKDFIITRGSRIFAYLPVFMGSLFFIDGKILEDDDKGMRPIEAFHIGYWLWLSSFILLAIAFMARSEENTLAHRTITLYINKTKHISRWIKCLIPIVLCIILESIALLPENNPFGKKDNLTGKSFMGYYLSCQRIGIQFKRDNIALAHISSTDFVGHFTLEFHGTYTYDGSNIVIDWGDNNVDMEYAVYDSIKHELTLFGGQETHVLGEN